VHALTTGHGQRCDEAKSDRDADGDQRPGQVGLGRLEKDDAQRDGHAGLDGDPEQRVVHQGLEDVRYWPMLRGQRPPNGRHPRATQRDCEHDHEDERSQ